MDQSLEIKKTENYYEYVFKNSIKSDFQICTKNKVIKAHKQVLGERNPVFLDQFLSWPHLDKIEILDLNPNAIEAFITYLYTGRISAENITEELFLVAHRYMDPILKNVCRERLIKTLSLKNAAKRFLTFLECQETTLIEETSLFVAENFNDLKIQLGFKQVLLNPDLVSAIFDAFDCYKITILTEDESQPLIDSATKSDLTVKVQKETFLAHKNILSTRNTVFKNVISTLSSESELSSSINIPEFDSSTFKIFLMFIYTQNIKLKDISKELMCIAHKYVDEKLKKICEDYLLFDLCEENAIELLELGADVGSEILKEKASELIADKYEIMKKQAAFKKMSENVVAVEAMFSRFKVNIDRLNNDLNVLKNTETYHCECCVKAALTVGQTLRSATFLMKKIQWFISIELSRDHPDYLGIFLYRNEKAELPRIKVNFSLKLTSNDDEEQDISKGPATNLFISNDGYGWPEFVKLSDLKDKTKGLMVDGKVTVKVTASFVK